MAKPADSDGKKHDALSAQERAAIKERLSDLGERLGDAQSRYQTPEDAGRRGSAIGYAFRLAMEFVIGVLVGGFIGWWLDYWLGTSPVFLLIMFIAGLAAGLLNVIRTAKMMQSDPAISGGEETASIDRDDKSDD